MKRSVLIILMLLFMFLLTGCGERTDSQEKSQDSKETDMFVTIQKSDNYEHPYDIVYQRDTKVMYAVSRGAYNSGTFTVLVNPDGTPLLYEEEGEKE